MPGAVADHPNRQTVFRVGSGVEVLHKQLTALQISEKPLMQAVELLGRDRLVDRAPGDRLFGAWLIHDVFVLRRAPGMKTGVDDEAAAEPDLALAAADRLLVQKRRCQVPLHRAEMVHALLGKPEAGLRCY